MAKTRQMVEEDRRNEALAQLAVTLYDASADGPDAFNAVLALLDQKIADDRTHPLHGPDAGARSLSDLMWTMCTLARAAVGSSVYANNEERLIGQFLAAWTA